MSDNRVSSKNWGRDPSSGALISTDNAGLAAYKTRRENQRRKDSQLSEMSNDINSLKEDFQELKSILLQAMNSNKNDG
jgi:hypothetical protein